MTLLIKSGTPARAIPDNCDCGVVIGLQLAVVAAIILIVVCIYMGYQLGKDSKCNGVGS